MQLYQRVKKSSEEHAGSISAMAKAVDKEYRTFVGYLNATREHNLWPLLPKILTTFPRISREWLYFNEGPMTLGPTLTPASDTSNTLTPMFEMTEEEHGRRYLLRSLPMVGLAPCGVLGMQQIMPFAVTVAPIVLSKNSLAVVASGESMVPVGIASGHICYCDPDQEPLAGEVVFFRQKDGLGALKLYLGVGEHPATYSFKGWLAANGTGVRKEFNLEIAESVLDFIAPVVLVRRRL